MKTIDKLSNILKEIQEECVGLYYNPYTKQQECIVEINNWDTFTTITVGSLLGLQTDIKPIPLGLIGITLFPKNKSLYEMMRDPNNIMTRKENMIKLTNFIHKEIDLTKSHGFKVLGYFPYSTKAIRNRNGVVSIPRAVTKDLENKLREVNIAVDNKIVIICEDTTNFGTDDFAINFKDFYVRFGTWDRVVDY